MRCLQPNGEGLCRARSAGAAPPRNNRSGPVLATAASGAPSAGGSSTCGPANHLGFPTDLVLLVVLWRLRYKLGLRDLAEMFGERGVVFTHEAVREWEARFAPLVAARLRARRHGRAGASWYADETHLRVHGRWCYLYRCIDRDGNLVDTMLSPARDLAAAARFFARARKAAGRAPERVTTDGHDASPRAIREALGPEVAHRSNRYLNNRPEQDHRGVRQRYYPMRGFGTSTAAARFCTAHDEVRDHLRARTRLGEAVPLARQRALSRARLAGLVALAAA